MKGEASDVVMETKETVSGNDLDTFPLLSPPDIFQVEQGTSKSEESELEKGLGACCRICLESESLAPGVHFKSLNPILSALWGNWVFKFFSELLKTAYYVQWYIWLNLVTNVAGDELIAPCMCKGTQQLVHRGCLDHWRSVKEGFAFSHCTTCKAQFHLRPELPEDHSWRKIKFKVFVARDVFLVFLAVQTAISVLGGITYLLYNGQLKDPFNGSWNEIFKKHPIPFYYCAGIYWNSLACFPWLFLCQCFQQIALQVQCHAPLDMHYHCNA
jgi:hypothetical protein